MEACSKANMNEVLEDVAIGALFHDLIEDQGDKINLNEIKEQFGELVAKIVSDCSDAEITKENKQKPEWSIRKQKYIDAISHKCKESLIVSSADKLHNARSILSDKQLIGEEIWNRFSASKEQTIWYYNEVYKALDKAWGENPLLNELKQAINELR
ncbi:MAG: hypothetical protein BWY78_00967 [Alphaproteobacteria bacterium ADurb.Bin438]|nr:MAG: hypothetical protein BWY78_00967 [Alphaproteobacteria bacterium ADurb.Bin438]